MKETVFNISFNLEDVEVETFSFPMVAYSSTIHKDGTVSFYVLEDGWNECSVIEQLKEMVSFVIVTSFRYLDNELVESSCTYF